MNTFKSICIGMVMVGLMAMSACATPTPLPPTAAPSGGLEGIVSDASNGDPVAGAQVTIAGQAGLFTLTSGADGKYKVSALPAGAYLVSVQATGYYVNAAQVGVVANVMSSGNILLEPAAAAVAPTAPGPTPTVAPSPTPVVITVVASPQPTPTPTPAPTRRPAAASSSSAAHVAPMLLEPGDGAVFVGPRRITFRWSGSCCLAADEYFVVSIPHPQGVEEAWVKTMAWESPDYLYLLAPRSRKLTWNVSVRRHTGEYPNGQWKGPIVSPLSATWSFTWLVDGDDKSPLPAPISPLALPRKP